MIGGDHDQSLRETERIPGLSDLLRLKIIDMKWW